MGISRKAPFFCTFVSILRHAHNRLSAPRFSSGPAALYTVPVQFRDMFRGKVGLRVGMATLQIPPGL